MIMRVVVQAMLSITVCVWPTSCQQKGRLPSKYLMNDRYVGWVRINYGIKDAPSLPVEGGFYILRIPESGLLDTSSMGEEGWAKDEYHYVSDDVLQKLSDNIDNGMIWGHVGLGTHMVAGHEPSIFEEFFVGTREQYEQIGIKCKNEESRPIPGPIKNCPH